MRISVPLYKHDWFLALILSALLVIGLLYEWSPLQRLEGAVYDSGVRMTFRNPGISRDMTLVLVGPDTADDYGAWSRSRERLAEVVAHASDQGAAAIAVLPSLSEAHSPAALEELGALERLLGEVGLSRSAPRSNQIIRGRIREARTRLDADQRLARAMQQAGQSFATVRFTVPGAGNSVAGDEAGVPGYLRGQVLDNLRMPDSASGATELPGRMDYMLRPELHAPRPGEPRWPLESLASAATGTGFLAPFADQDGVTRSFPLALKLADQWYPSLALVMAATMLEVPLAEVVIEPGQGVALGNRYLATDPHLRWRPGFHARRNGQPAFRTASYEQLMNGDDEAPSLRDQVVIVGLAPGAMADRWASPAAAASSAAEIQANLVASLVDEDYYARPDWARWVELGTLALAVAVTVVVASLLPVNWALFVALLLAVLVLGTGYYFMLGARIAVLLAVPALMMPVVTGLVVLRRVYDAQRAAQAARLAESDRQLGLTYQGQGQLDLALDRFRALPPEPWALELMYNLARDFERKRQHNKALIAYDHILHYAPDFSDVADRRNRVDKLENTLMLRTRATSEADTLLLGTTTDSTEKPTLGRYTIESHLGRGAMGAVYKGVDPRINRVVAIKTLSLQDEFEEDEIAEVRERFFNEAEVAGKLNHPHIVTIYDAGEEQDLAYIAMEFLEGSDLREYLRDGKNLPAIDRAMEITSQVAEALDYAHKHGVIHRDIKPSNIMFDQNTGKIKLADFGVARIASSTKTRTGTVVGTPPYMSPEQLAGHRVDGRSDVFSLGVVLFELIAGRRPFEGDSIATLMYQISNEKHPPVSEFRKGVPQCLTRIIDKALHKDPDKRYQTGGAMRLALVRCIRNMVESEG